MHVTPENATLILIDYNTDLMLGSHSMDQRLLRNNAVALTKFGAAFSLPTIYTGDDENTPLGPYMPEVKAALPADAVSIHRSTVDSMRDPQFRAALEATGRRTLIMAGITTDMCLAQAAVSAAEAGYDVHVVVDASATWDVQVEQAAVLRMTQAGVHPRTWVELAAELAGGYVGPYGDALRGLFAEHLAEFAAMMNNFAPVMASAAAAGSR